MGAKAKAKEDVEGTFRATAIATHLYSLRLGRHVL